METKYYTKFIFQIAGSDDYLNSAKQLSSGFLSGVISKIFIYPLDFIKKRLQLQDFIHSRDGFGKVSLNSYLRFGIKKIFYSAAVLLITNNFQKFMCKGLVDCVYLTIKEESAFGLFKGLSPSLVKAGLSTALHLAFYEHIFKLLNSY